MKIAIVIGATGLTGKFLTRFLLASDTYEKVVVTRTREKRYGKPDTVHTFFHIGIFIWILKPS